MRKCFDRHGCDKGIRHGYERVYEPAFKDIRNEPIRLLEIGILRGASLAAWLDYFPNATIFGIDTFDRVPSVDVPILQHSRVDWYPHDSTEPLDLAPANMWDHFDIIIDDGLHTHTAQRQTFENFMPYADRYFIEDVWAFDHMTPEQKQHKWLKRGGYSEQEYGKLLTVLKPYTTEFHDQRAGHQPDSFIISAT